jgi:hypothetical protein
LERLASSLQDAAAALRTNDTLRAADALDEVSERLRRIAREITARDRHSTDDWSSRNLPPQD